MTGSKIGDITLKCKGSNVQNVLKGTVVPYVDLSSSPNNSEGSKQQS